LTDGPADENASVLIVDQPRSLEATGDATNPSLENETEAGAEDHVAKAAGTSSHRLELDNDRSLPSNLQHDIDTAEHAISELLQQPLITGVDALSYATPPPIRSTTAQVTPSAPAPEEPIDQVQEPVRHYDAWQLDEIVDRFIQYDIGRLQGAAGMHARWEFERLGPEAIPALVRGLNKSASIRASCPIAVISSKLHRLLAVSEDPTHAKYAIENVGRNISWNAPHYRAIQTLGQRWRIMYGEDSQQIADGRQQRQPSPPRPSPLTNAPGSRQLGASGPEDQRHSWSDRRQSLLTPK
jgi:hypothetical protein